MNAPVVRFGRVHVSVTAKEPGTAVSPGKRVRRGLMTGGAPDLKYLKVTGRTQSLQSETPPGSDFNALTRGGTGEGGGVSYTVTLRLGQLSPKVPPCSLKVMRFHTAIMVSSGTLK